MIMFYFLANRKATDLAALNFTIKEYIIVSALSHLPLFDEEIDTKSLAQGPDILSCGTFDHLFSCLAIVLLQILFHIP